VTEEQIEALIAWVRAEIDHALARNAVDESGYTASAHRERDVAERLEVELREKLRS
jgi:hypothetical protein